MFPQPSWIKFCSRYGQVEDYQSRRRRGRNGFKSRYDIFGNDKFNKGCLPYHKSNPIEKRNKDYIKISLYITRENWLLD